MMQNSLPSADPDKAEIQIHALKATQPILYIAVMQTRQLGRIAVFDVRRVLQEERDVERYLGIQRPLNSQRVTELEDYVNYKDATFPTSIIISVEGDYADFDPDRSLLTLRNYREGEESPSVPIRRLARVIDGQHRIAGLYAFKGENFDVPVTIFVGSDLSDQAYVFATVNLEQTKVSKGLEYGPFALAKTRSPQRTCHNIAITLDADRRSPLYKRIKRLGVATPGRIGETITQATFVESLMDYISSDPRGDRDRLLRGRSLQRPMDKESRRLIFRNMFIDEKDHDIARVIFNFFQPVKERWPDGWETRERGLVLNKTSGFRALMRILRPLYLRLANGKDIVLPGAFLRELNRIPVGYRDFNTGKYPPGSSGESALRSDLLTWLGLPL